MPCSLPKPHPGVSALSEGREVWETRLDVGRGPRLILRVREILTKPQGLFIKRQFLQHAGGIKATIFSHSSSSELDENMRPGTGRKQKMIISQWGVAVPLYRTPLNRRGVSGPVPLRDGLLSAACWGPFPSPRPHGRSLYDPPALMVWDTPSSLGKVKVSRSLALSCSLHPRGSICG